MYVLINITFLQIMVGNSICCESIYVWKINNESMAKVGFQSSYCELCGKDHTRMAGNMYNVSHYIIQYNILIGFI